MKMNIEEIKYLKNKVMPVCRTFFYIYSARVGGYGKISMLKSIAAMLCKKNTVIKYTPDIYIRKRTLSLIAFLSQKKP